MPESIQVQSKSKEYTLRFLDSAFSNLSELDADRCFIIIDKNVLCIYENNLNPLHQSSRYISIEANEQAKSYENLLPTYKALIEAKARRSDLIVAIGGGVIQDIACFVASTYMRGMEWVFYPTTLVAQADSCLGGKSSINVGPYKNLIGTISPPSQVFLAEEVLLSLAERDFLSGLGEVIKAHIIEGKDCFAELARDLPAILLRKNLQHSIRRSLLVKKRLVELDEMDRGERRLLNYGHSFGHAIESATDFAIPHGIAVCMGMQIANTVSKELGLFADEEYFIHMNSVFKSIYQDYIGVQIPFDKFSQALGIDKKNSPSSLGLVLLGANGKPGFRIIEDVQRVLDICQSVRFEA